MKEYREVLTFNYKNKLFKLFIDKSGNRFYMQTDMYDNLFYTNIDDYIEIDSILSHPYIPMIQPIIPDNQNNNKYDNQYYNQYYNNQYYNNQQFNNQLYINQQKKKNRKIKIIPKVLIGGVAIVLSPILIRTYINNYQNKFNNKPEISNEYITTEEDNTPITQTTTEEKNEYDPNKFEYSSAARSIPTKLEVDTFFDNGSIYYIYDTTYFSETSYKNKPTLDEVKSAINSNSNITSNIKPTIINYVEDLFEKYPDIDCRTFIENIKTLEIEVCTQSELSKYTFNDSSLGCYIRSDNKICILNNADYENDMWPKQTIYHELSHCFRNGNFTKDGHEYIVRFSGLGLSNDIIEESLNSLFAVSLFDYEEKDIAYQLQSNMNKIMIDSMDNYSIDDYANHSLSYYAQKLDEFNNDDNYATTMLALMEFQYNDFHSDWINAEQSEYYPLYEYISNMYYKKNLNNSMSYDEAKKIADKLVEDLLFDVPEDYNIDVNYFYNYFDNYCSEIGIQVPKKVR